MAPCEVQHRTENGGSGRSVGLGPSVQLCRSASGSYRPDPIIYDFTSSRTLSVCCRAQRRGAGCAARARRLLCNAMAELITPALRTTEARTQSPARRAVAAGRVIAFG